MQAITLSDGTVLEVPDGSSIVTEDGKLTVALPPGEPAIAEVSEDEPAPDPAAEPVDDSRITALEAVLNDRVVPFVEAVEADRQAALDAHRAELAAPIPLPALDA